MSIAFLAVITALLYLAAAGLQLASALQNRGSLTRSGLIIAFFALACHGVVTSQTVFSSAGVNFSLFKLVSMLFLAINYACVAALIRRPLQNLMIILFPISAIAVILATLGPDTSEVHSIATGVALHVGSSVMAYSMLSLAAIQAALLAAQDAQLKRRQMGGLIGVLPPLQMMERMLFELIWVGVVALSLSIASGFIFMDDIFAQHLVHKTVLSLIAWALFSLLLWGHYRLGWRSQTAVRFTLSGFAFLMLAFLGSKLVLELVLEQA